MKALILDFSAFDNKEKTKSYYRFNFWDLESKALYAIFTEQQYLPIPDGVIPDKKECRETFPRIADIDFSIQQYRTKEGKTAWSPRVSSINSWRKAEIK